MPTESVDLESRARVLKVSQDKILAHDSIIHGGMEYPYVVVCATYQPKIPYFAGFIGEVLYVSAQVPHEYRPYVLKHELEFRAMRGEPGHCEAATRRELREMPEDMRIEYAKIRYAFFKGLVEFYQQSETESPLLPEFERSLWLCENYLS